MRDLTLLCGEPRVLTGISLANQAVNSVAGLIDLLRSLPRLGLVIEVGSYAGVSTETFLHFCERLIAVDHWHRLDRAKREFDARLGAAQQVSYLRMASLEAAAFLANGIADLVYLDADHSESAVRADILAWKPKVKPGGFLAGHDYYDGVRTAVDALLDKPSAVFSDSSWLVCL